MMRLGMGAAALAVGLALPQLASAADVWTEPHPGVRMLQRTTNAPLRIWALEIDLCHPGVSLRATKSAERQRTTSSFAQLVGAQAAVNGDFFSYADYSTSGLAMGDGMAWPGTGDTTGSGWIAFGPGRAEVAMPAEILANPEPWMRELVSGRRDLVSDGLPYPANGGDLCTNRHPRTAAGLSEDGRTLILAVVDGRSTVSIGMYCTELGELMAELGAHDATMLDGGGSSTMWVAGEGIVNDPSDGTQRVVANHLAVLAAGLEDPGSCDRSWEEAFVHAGSHDASTTTDIDGDGDADLCARAAAGIRCALSEPTGAGATVVGPELSDDSGWADPTNWGSLRMGDLDGDGDADLCARANAGVRCWLSEGDGFPTLVEGPPLADDVGWANPQYGGTLRLADVDGDGRDDLCARAAAGFRCWPSLGDGFDEPWVLDALSDDAGFLDMSRYGTIRMGDIDADARADVCARTETGMACWRFDGQAFVGPIEGPEWADAVGWAGLPYWSTIRLVDIDGDRRADLCARAAAGLRCHLSTGDGFGEAIVGPQWSDDSGWADYDNYSTIRFGDIDGDGARDVCARANAGIRCALWTGDAFGPIFSGPALSDDSGWDVIRHYSTVRLVDIDGDGRDDLCARAAAGVLCWPSTGEGFETEALPGPQWADNVGWGAPQYYETIRGTTPGQRCVATESCNGEDDDCDGEIDEGCPTDDGGSSSAGETGTGGGGTGDTGDTGTGGSDGLPGGTGVDADLAGCGCASGRGYRGARLTLVYGVLLVAAGRRRRRARAQ